MRKQRFIAIMLIVLTGVGLQELAAQNFAAPYLLRSTSVEGEAFGNAYTALANDASASFWNPAGLTGVTSYSFTGLYSADMAYDRSFNAASAAYNLGESGTIGISFTQAGVNDIRQYDRNNSYLGNFNTNFIAIGGSYALEVIDNLSLGATARYLSQNLETITDEGYHLDLGAKYQTEMINVGFVAQNLVGDLGPDQLPMIVRSGLGVKAFDGLRAGVDFEIQDAGGDYSHSFVSFGVGYDLKINESISVGLQSGLRDSDISFGGKLTLNTEAIGVDVNYAYVNEPAFFGNSHRIGLTLFGF